MRIPLLFCIVLLKSEKFLQHALFSNEIGKGYKHDFCEHLESKIYVLERQHPSPLGEPILILGALEVCIEKKEPAVLDENLQTVINGLGSGPKRILLILKIPYQLPLISIHIPVVISVVLCLVLFPIIIILFIID